ncbi:hypothetical protein [Natrarchaeobius oligotrophus]|uniref:hypothetical protein n=1 Tax=Natrarchaeobius oligotrophus TaxID=3455743 RepID=UPI0014045D53|nr:hypothetical protein [Natrarchaeobius chitinivorans]
MTAIEAIERRLPRWGLVDRLCGGIHTLYYLPNADNDVEPPLYNYLITGIYSIIDQYTRKAIGMSSDGTVPPENYELWDEKREELRCPFCDGRILRIGNYGECTDCGERFRK